MEFLKFGDRYVLRLEPGEELQATLRDFVERQEIRGGYFIAFGAFERVRLQYFDVERKQYRDNPVGRQVEVVSLMGNIAWAQGKPVLHVHGAFGDSEARTYSGHVAEGVVRIVTDPIGHWLVVHTAGLPLTMPTAAGIWGVTGFVLFYAASCYHLGAQLLWPVYGAATAAMAWSGTDVSEYRPVAVGLIAIAWSVLSLLALRGRRYPRTAQH